MVEFPTFMGSWPWPWIRAWSLPFSSLIEYYLYTKFHRNRINFLWTDGHTDVRKDGNLPPMVLGRLPTFGSRPNNVNLFSEHKSCSLSQRCHGQDHTHTNTTILSPFQVYLHKPVESWFPERPLDTGSMKLLPAIPVIQSQHRRTLSTANSAYVQVCIWVEIDDEVKVTIVATKTVDGRAKRTDADIGKKFPQRRLQIMTQEVAQSDVEIRHHKLPVRCPHLRFQLHGTIKSQQKQLLLQLLLPRPPPAMFNQASFLALMLYRFDPVKEICVKVEQTFYRPAATDVPAIINVKAQTYWLS